MSQDCHGPAFRWFAWRPARTQDRGWRWLRMLWKRREIHDDYEAGTCDYFRTWVEGPPA